MERLAEAAGLFEKAGNIEKAAELTDLINSLSNNGKSRDQAIKSKIASLESAVNKLQSVYGVDSNAKIEWSHLFENDPKFNIYRLATNDKMHTLKLHVRTFRKDKGKEIEVHRDIYHFSVYHAKATLVRITKGKPDD